MKKGIKIICSDKSDMKSVEVCSECFYILDKRDRFCHRCGAILSPLPFGGEFEYIAERRKEYQEDEETGWEDE